jgi:hypothetical protein
LAAPPPRGGALEAALQIFAGGSTLMFSAPC